MTASSSVRACFGRVLAREIKAEWRRNANRPGVIVPMTKVSVGMFAHYAASCSIEDYLWIGSNANHYLRCEQITAYVTPDPLNQQFLVEF